MFEMPLDALCNQIVSSLLPEQARENEAVYISFDVRMQDYAVPSPSVGFSAGLHLIYHCRPHSNYITVFSAVTESPFAKLKEIPADQWQHESSHDSCWRDVSIFNSTFFEMATDLNELRTKKGLPTLPPKDFSTFVSFRPFNFNKLYEWVRVEVERDPNDLRNYKRTLKLL